MSAIFSDFKYRPVPFDHTYVLYDPKDPISTLSVHFSLLPIYAMVFYTAWFLICREIEPVIVVGGHVVGDVLTKVVKKLIKQPRPDFHKDFGKGTGLSYGMPSAHSSFMGFLAAYFICIFLFKMQNMNQTQRLTGCAVLFVSSILVAYSRVYLLYHTIQQVCVGLMFGAFMGLVYFVIISVARDVGFIDWILNWSLVKYFYIKDTYFHNYQTFADEYTYYQMLLETGKKELLA